MKVMLVDDSKTTRTIQKGALSQIGCREVIEAADGLDALSKCMATELDLILLDWNMPNMDGMQFIEEFRKKDTKTPVIMVTTEAEKSRVVSAIKAGVNNYILKPFTPDHLRERVKETLNAA